jgi:hypothetical protein
VNTSTGFIVAQFASIGSLVIAVSFVIGLVLFGVGLYGFYKYGQGPDRHSIRGPILAVIAGTAMLCSGTLYSIFMRSTLEPDWSASGRNALAIDASTVDLGSAETGGFLATYVPDHLGATIVGFVFTVGLIYFIWGLYLLKDIGSQSQQGSAGVAKPLTHIFGGMIAMNIMKFSCMVSATIGYPGLCLG